MFFIASGQVEIVGTNPPVRLGDGAFFGELALLGGGVRTATVVATMPTTLLVLEVADYRIFAAQYPDLAKAVEEEGARRLAARAAPQPETAPQQGSNDVTRRSNSWENSRRKPKIHDFAGSM